MSSENRSVPGYQRAISGVIASGAGKGAARSVTISNNTCNSGAHILLVVSLKTLNPTNLVLTVDGYDPESGLWYNILTGTAVSSAAGTVIPYRVYPTSPTSAGANAQDFLPTTFRVVVTPTGEDTSNYFTYSVGINMY